MAGRPVYSVHFATKDASLIDWLKQTAKTQGLSVSEFLRKTCQLARQNSGDSGAEFVLVQRAELVELSSAIKHLGKLARRLE